VVKADNKKLGNVSVTGNTRGGKVIRWRLVTIHTILRPNLVVVEEYGCKILRIHMTYRTRGRKMRWWSFMAISTILCANRAVIKRNILPAIGHMAGAAVRPIGPFMGIIVTVTGVTGRVGTLINALYVTDQAI
jgi:hypothetical protein